ncbi:hypothetical protein F5Y18DRAFT_172159 [Xylariaceae sp. FL1019]|nr:hypothetical protein F5Y18DRAFT_172159 [Xylariaceae sp. FL1019]
MCTGVLLARIRGWVLLTVSVVAVRSCATKLRLGDSWCPCLVMSVGDDLTAHPRSWAWDGDGNSCMRALQRRTKLSLLKIALQCAKVTLESQGTMTGSWK